MRYIGKKRHCPPPPEEIGPRILCLSKAIKHEINTAVSELGLFSGQQDIILALIENNGVTLSELSKMLGVSSATASISVKRMEKAGFIEKRADERDARIIRLYPTELAEKTPEKIRAHIDNMEQHLKQNMSKEEALELSRLLDIAINNLMKGSEQDA